MNYFKKISTSVFRRSHRRNRTESDLETTEQQKTHLKTLSDTSDFVSFPRPIFEEEFVDEEIVESLLPELDPNYVIFREGVQRKNVNGNLKSHQHLCGDDDLVPLYPVHGTRQNQRLGDSEYEQHEQNKRHYRTPVKSGFCNMDYIIHSAPTYLIRPMYYHNHQNSRRKSNPY